jgi:hypothetical protein
MRSQRSIVTGLLVGVLASLLFAAAVSALEVGQKAPDFTLNGTDGTLRSTIHTHRELALENLVLRQQLAVWKARQPRPQLMALDRIFWVVSPEGVLAASTGIPCCRPSQ